ncbi:MAG TPA: hypothetical protein VNN73_22595 [Blastocatellia bacterium]|nr:hypothetical protein [Blastocatellia bacterium]
MDQLDNLRLEIDRAEEGFQDAVRNYLLSPLETEAEYNKVLTELFQSITEYRKALDKLRACLGAMPESKSFIPKYAIEKAIVSLSARDAALERLLKRVRNLIQPGDEIS